MCRTKFFLIFLAALASAEDEHYYNDFDESFYSSDYELTSLHPVLKEAKNVEELAKDETKIILMITLLLLLVFSFIFFCCWVLIYLIKIIHFQDDMLLDDGEVSVGEKALHDLNVQC